MPVEDQFNWVSPKNNQSGPVASVAWILSVPNAPDPDNADDDTGGRTRGGKKERRGNK